MSSSQITAQTTGIPGLLVLRLPVHLDARGWFKENWQRTKFIESGVPSDFIPVQNNVSYNIQTGVTRGFHAEPWDKLISVNKGKVYGAWVDLREGKNFGASYGVEIGPETAVFVPRGVANAFQTLEDDTVYSYLVNEHWSESAIQDYAYVNLYDPALKNEWPIPQERSIISDKDLSHPLLEEVSPMKNKKILVIGARGQLGKALQSVIPSAVAVTRGQLDISQISEETIDWRQFSTIINAAAFTDVDLAETEAGRRQAWESNVHGVQNLAKIALKYNLTFIHFSSDYVFDGSRELHTEEETFSPLNVYGQTKAAADSIVGILPKHYIFRISWVIGEGKNFIQTMNELATKGVNPKVVNDQYGRLTYAKDVAHLIKKILEEPIPFGTYNFTSKGPVTTWAEIAQKAFLASGYDPARVVPVSTKEYYSGVDRAIAVRPRNSVLSMDKLEEAMLNHRK